jgi:hypothetical protein
VSFKDKNIRLIALSLAAFYSKYKLEEKHVKQVFDNIKLFNINV